MKKYKAKTCVSINVQLSNGKNRHVTFDSVSGCGSVYYTDDVELQRAIERHYKYGKLFKTDEAFGQIEIEPAEPEEAEETETSNKKVSVSDPDDAKSYLASTFGVSRTKLKSLKAIREAAAQYGVEFEGLE